MSRYLRFSIGSCLALCTLSLSVAQDQVDSSEILDGFNITAAEIDRLENGGILAFSDETYENTKRELSADAMVVVKTTHAAVLHATRDTTTVIPTKLLIDHADISSEADFAGVKFTEAEFSEVKDLFDAKAYKDFNLSDSEVAMLRERLQPHRNSDRDSQVTAASDAMRALLIGRYNEYRAKGLDGIAGYRRSKRKIVDVGRELQLTTDTIKPFDDEFPEFVRVMVGYPTGSECCEHHFRWLKVKIHKRPAFSLSHTIIQKTDKFVLITERQYYVSNTVNSLQVTMAWLPYAEGGYFGLAMSASADILDSMVGRMLRPVGRNKAKDLVTDVMHEIREELEGDNEP